MVKSRWYLLVLVVVLLIAITAYALDHANLSLFFLVLMLGGWIVFTWYFLERMKYSKEFRSPHNSSFLILGSLVFSLIYCYYGHFTIILGNNLLASNVIYISAWSLLFACPFLLYGTIVLSFCFSKYDWVYVGRKPVSARKFGLASCVIIAILETFYAFILFYPNRLYIDIFPLLMGIDIVYLIIRHGIFGRHPVAVNLNARPIQRPASLSEKPISRSQPPRRTEHRPKPQEKPAARNRPKPRPTPNVKPTPAVNPRAIRVTTHVSGVQQQSKTHPGQSLKVKKYEMLRPKSTVLSEEDFKCIFCFQVPQPSADRRRGFVICPNCRHPAHADEFKNWTHNSKLCSRCNSPLPEKFRRQPVIVPANEYLAAMKYFIEKAKKQRSG